MHTINQLAFSAFVAFLAATPATGQAPNEGEDDETCSSFGLWRDEEGVCHTPCEAPRGATPPKNNTPPPPVCIATSESGGCLAFANGLAGWHVTEPSANLWIKDTPLHYKASRGHTVRFTLAYKNRQSVQGDADNNDPRIFSFGSHWHSPWRSYLESIPTETTNFWAYLGGGAARKYTSNQINQSTLAKLTNVSGTNVMQSPNGTTLIFGLQTNIGGVTRHFLTRKEDINGNAITFQYWITNGAIRLDKVLDVDNRAITFEYAQAGNYSNVVTKVIGPVQQLANN
jgi:hypothetical protein